MKKIAVLKSTGSVLDWLVAKCEGHKPVFTRHWATPSHPEDPRRVCVPAPSWVQPFEPSTNWAQGGPIIEREAVNIGTQRNEPGFRPNPDSVWHAQMDTRSYVGYGPTVLIAAMRCYVSSKLGDIVEVPEELFE